MSRVQHTPRMLSVAPGPLCPKQALAFSHRLFVGPVQPHATCDYAPEQNPGHLSPQPNMENAEPSVNLISSVRPVQECRHTCKPAWSLFVDFISLEMRMRVTVCSLLSPDPPLPFPRP